MKKQPAGALSAIDNECNMLEIHTERMRLLPLTAAQLKWYLNDVEKLEQDLGFPVSRAVVTEEVRQAIGAKRAKMLRARKAHHPWYTYWLMVLKQRPFAAGLIGFKGYPNRAGEVEVGYGIDPGYQNRGYTTEAVKALFHWAFKQPECQAIISQTARTNLASQRVVQKAGMWFDKEVDGNLLWRLTKEKINE